MTTPPATIPLYRLTNFNRAYSETDEYGPFASAEQAQQYVDTQLPADHAPPQWCPSIPETTLTAEVQGGRWRIMKVWLRPHSTPEFDAAVLHLAAEILKARFPLFTEHERQALIAAAGEIKRLEALAEAERAASTAETLPDTEATRAADKFLGDPFSQVPRLPRVRPLPYEDEPDEESPALDYDPGPEIDDQGGMSERL